MSPSKRRRNLWVFAAVIVIAAAAGLVRLAPWMEINRGIFHHLRGDHARAIETLSQARIRPPDFLPVHYLVESHLRLGQRQAAVDLLRRLSREFPSWAAPRLEQGLLDLRAGDRTAAWPVFAWASGLSDGEESDAGLSSQIDAIADAVVLLSGQQPARALARLRETSPPVSRHSPDEPGEVDDVLTLLEADALMGLGRWDDAVEPLDRSLELNGDNALSAALRSLLLARSGDWHGARLWLDIARSLSPGVANQVVHHELRRQIALANRIAAPAPGVPSLPRDAALAWLCDMAVQSGDWETVRALIESQPAPEAIASAAVWGCAEKAYWELDMLDLAEEARARASLLRPDWNLDPDWPIAVSRYGSHWQSSRWTPIPLPPAEALPEGSGPFGTNLDEVSMFSNTHLDLTVPVERTGWRRLALHLAARPSNQIWAVAEVSLVPGPPVRRYVVGRDASVHIVPLPFAQGENTVRIAYVNDTERVQSGEDRNLVVSRVYIENDHGDDLVP